MIKARKQPVFLAYHFNIDHFKGKEEYPVSVTEKIKALHSYNNHFCLIWKSDVIIFNNATEDLNSKFTTVNNRLSLEKVDSFMKCEYKPKKIKTQLAISILNDLKNCISCYRSSKMVSKDKRDLKIEEQKKCKKDIFDFDGNDCISQMWKWP